ncbi:MAG: acyl-CoA dehydrogenase [Syntrophaceae bacterium]|nr:acyl-CoA dehydrogenase [Syntrophaceae bacterium]
MFELSEELQEFRATVRRMAEEELAPRALDLDAVGEFPRKLPASLASLGIIGAAQDRETGGSGLGYLAGLVAAEEISRVYPSIAFFLEGTLAPVHALERYGTEEQRKRYLTPVLRGKRIICLAATEPTGGSDVANLNTEAAREGDTFRVRGRKVYITNGGIADYCLLLVRTGNRASMLMVEKKTPGFRVGRRESQTGFRSVPISELLFEDCRVPGGNLIGREGDGHAIALSSFIVSRPTIGAIGLGIAEGAFEIALRFARERVLYGKPISRLQHIQFMLAEMETEIEKARWVVYYPGAALDRGVQPRRIGKWAARAKAVGAETALLVTQKAMQILGGQGVNPQSHLPRLLNDALELFPASGTVEVMKIIQATEILRRAGS